MFVAVLMISSLLSVAYLMPVVGRAFLFSPSPSGSAATAPEAPGASEMNPAEGTFWSNVKEAPVLCVAPLCATALGCVALFFYAPEIYELLRTMKLE